MPDLDVVEDANDVFRAPVNAVPAPTREVPFTVDRDVMDELVLDLAGSPARSARVFRFGSISFTTYAESNLAIAFH